MAGVVSASSLQWPELYGFYIYGNGPAYVIYVEPSSISDLAGIHCGDRIIEIDSQDVSKLSSTIVKYMARNSKQAPPAISVQSSSKLIELLPDFKLNRMNLFGFTVKGHNLDKNVINIPVIVDQIVESSQAYSFGLRPGDIIIEINSKRIRSSESVLSFLNVNKNLIIKYIPISSDFFKDDLKTSKLNSSKASSDVKIIRAKKFYSMVSLIFEILFEIKIFITLNLAQ